MKSEKTKSGRPAMLALSERATYQDLKEAVSVYYFLLKNGKMTKKKLKEMINRHPTAAL